MNRLILATAFATLPLAAHAADLGPTEFTWTEEEAPPEHQTLVRLSLAATYFDMDVANGFAGVVEDNPYLFVRQPDDGFRFETWGITGDVEAWIPTTMS